MMRFTFSILILLMCASCNKQNHILADQDFDNGNWLLIKRNFLSDSVVCIYDRQILKDNARSFYVEYSADDKGTTCDGEILLYKNGKVVNSQEYLSHSHITEPEIFKRHYKPCKLIFEIVSPTRSFKNTWDSVSNILNNYPIFNKEKSADTSIVLYYQFARG